MAVCLCYCWRSCGRHVCVLLGGGGCANLGSASFPVGCGCCVVGVVLVGFLSGGVVVRLGYSVVVRGVHVVGSEVVGVGDVLVEGNPQGLVLGNPLVHRPMERSGGLLPRLQLSRSYCVVVAMLGSR